MENSYHSFEDLLIWQESMDLCMNIYDALQECHDFGLRNQMERSSVSIPSNIAEGFELSTNRAFVRHLYISKGSSGELRTQLYIAIKRHYISPDLGNELVSKARKIAGMIQNFIVARKKRNRLLLLKIILPFLPF
ncbi:MAG TPA: four helix bundle protein [Saprospiraceae bacterium]|nr:four helix bundle protein [Saprospiraceae bacterium]